MKKTYSRIAAALTASAAALGLCRAFPASAADSIRLMGDLDGDLKVTAADAQITLTLYTQSVSGKIDNTANHENGNADIDMNNEIDVTDAQNILNYYCQTLAGKQPLWADFREVSYHDGQDYTVISAATGERIANDNPFELKGMYLEIGCAEGAPGETVTVPVYLAGADDLISFVMFIDPPAGLEPVSITSKVDEDFELWHPSPEMLKDSEEDYSPYYAYLPKGSIVFANTDNIHPQDGYVIAYYSYKIPEDAQPGTVYPVCLNAAKTAFTAYHPEKAEPVQIGEDEWKFDSSSETYQYTLLNGVVAVK